MTSPSSIIWAGHSIVFCRPSQRIWLRRAGLSPQLSSPPPQWRMISRESAMTRTPNRLLRPDRVLPQPGHKRTAATAPGSNAPAHLDYQALIVHRPVNALHEADVRLVRNSEALTEAATRLVACSGACMPVLAEADGTIVAGEEFFRAYRDLGYDIAPVIIIDQLTKAEMRAFRLAVRRIGQMTVFDEVVLAQELGAILLTPDLIRMTPFSMPEVDQHLAHAALLAAIPDLDDAPPATSPVAVSQVGDLWLFGEGSRLLHGDSCEVAAVAKLFGEDCADFVCTDPPYGIAIANVSRHHREFIQGSNVSEDEIGGLFMRFLGAMLPHLRDGCMVDTFIDHRRLYALMTALRQAGLIQKCICTWDKEAAGMGAPFRNVAEHIIVSKFGTAPHIDNVQLGKHGRNRSTIWRARGYAGFGPDRAEALGRHATCKPGRPDCRGDPRLLACRQHHLRCLHRERHHPGRRPPDAAPLLRHRARRAVRRCLGQANGGTDRQTGASRGYEPNLRRDRCAASLAAAATGLPESQAGILFRSCRCVLSITCRAGPR